MQIRVEYTALNRFFADYSRNISRGGIFIRTEQPLPVGERLTFSVVAPELDEPLLLQGVVRWVAGAKAQEPGMGIAFEYASPEQRRDNERRIEALMQRKLGRVLGRRG